VRIHPHDLLLQELAATSPETRKRCLEHLSTCQECQDKLLWLYTLGPHLPQVTKILPFGRGRSHVAEYDPALENASRSLSLIENSYFGERVAAPGLYTELIQHPIDRHVLLVRNCPRFHTWGFCEFLLRRSWEQNFLDPTLGERLALLAVEVLDHLDASIYRAEPLEDLRARAWGYVANSRRVQADLQGAEEAFSFAFSFLRMGTGDLMERALLLDLKASLLTKQGRFSKALGLLRRSVSIFLELGEKHRAGRALVGMATVHSFAGDPAQAILLLYRALPLIDPSREPRLLLIARHNLIDDLIETGQFMEAQKMLVRARPLYKRFPQPWFQNPRKWVEGKTARGLGQVDRAETLLLAARDGFLLTGAAYDTALVSFDLASLYAEQGRMAELRRLAEEMIPIFSSRQIHREALAALDYWRQAVNAEGAGAAVIAGIASFLKKARHNPELRFQRPE
jgi:tetratricopeptide (TPR) repeat protein